MPTHQQIDRAALGRARLAERARRVGRIRRTVVAATLSAFIMAWGVIVFDGSMGSTTLASATSGGAAATSTGTSASSDTTASSGSSASDGSFSSSGTPPAVTTSQS